MWILVVLSFILVYIFLFRQKQLLDIFGPNGLPYIGNALQLDPNAPHQTLAQWVKQYGDIYKIKVFGKQIIVVSGNDVIRKVVVTQSDDFANRPSLYRLKYLAQDDIIFQSASPRWALLKKHCMTSLKLVGEGVQRLELIAGDVLKEMVGKVEEKAGEPFNPRPLLHEAVSNVNATLVFGWQLSKEEERDMLHFDIRAQDVCSNTPAGMALDLFPWLRYLPNKMFEELKDLKAIGDRVIGSATKKTVGLTEVSDEYESALRDIITYSKQRKQDDRQKPVSMTTFESVAMNMMSAGNITTSIALTGFVAILANDMELQKICQLKVEDILGERPASLSDKSSLPFIESLILELLRYISHVPIAIPHVSTKDTSLNGHFIPRDTEVWVNLWHLHHNDALWEEPWRFKPDRFLNKEGNLLPTDHQLRKQLLPFGTGRRVCVGEILARNRLFLFTCTLLQKFTFFPESESVAQAADPRMWTFGTVLVPPDFNVRVVSNQQNA